MSNPIEITNLSVKYNYANISMRILENVNLTVKKGEMVGIMGLSGCGKSTLLFCICGLIPHLYKEEIKGTVLIDGVSINSMRLPEIATKIGIVFQNPDNQLFSPTVEDEIAFGPENLLVEREEIGMRIKDALNKVGMEKYRFSSPHQLSGGEKQRIALASVLSLKPNIFLFDEILSQIDKKGRTDIKEIIKNLKEDGNTIVMIDHNIDNFECADRVLFLKNGVLEDYKDA